VTEDISKGKRSRKRARKLSDATGAHSESSGYSDQLAQAQGAGNTHAFVPGICDRYHEAVPDMGKSAEAMAASATTAGRPDVAAFNEARLSEPLGRDHGHQSPSSGDHGAGTGRNDHIACGAPGSPGVGPVSVNLNQSGTQVLPFMKRTENPVTFIGESGFHSQFSGTDQPAGADGGLVSASQLDTSMAGRFQGMQARNPDPGNGSRDYGIARNSATPASAGNYLRDPESHAVSNKSKLDVMKDTMRRIG
jgi:hypothetical protein